MENDGSFEGCKHLNEQALKKLKTIKDLKEKIIESEDITLDYTENLEKLHRLYVLGVISNYREYIQQ